jgi:hypothetical protein
MQAQPFPQAAPPPAGPPKKKTNWLLWVGVGCLSLTIICCVVPVSGFFIGNASAKSDAEEFVGDFAAAGRQRDTTRLYEMLDYYYRSSTDATRLGEALPRCTGLSTSTSVEIVDITVDHPFDDFMLVDVRYQTPTGPVEADIGVSRENGELRIGTYDETNPAQGYGYCNLRGSSSYH